ncbi:tyrosine-type recombinase/integrase [Shewanella sp. SW36]|uniref:tyrosine-type recombinase/integrase n=1 Tax=unclassified Shewanella TaxID=196818 RepID=UPI0021DB5757|nr:MULTISPECIES: tyrosine-type recombinase/integrase [unclassified Shewanella]MCU7974897.1 tyrosine-type recombinase/integrase [Shewanella sp. SW36]MCU7990286.1 tyrosine-type recombinase/integrase [Shewanella sp. SW1]MCU8052744.1 tyrosine-type recombinase/integrase [Shewanella sp. SM43]
MPQTVKVPHIGVEYGKANPTVLKRWLTESTSREFRDKQYPCVKFRANQSRTKASLFLVLHENGKSHWKKQGSWPALCLKTFFNGLPQLLAKRVIGEISNSAELVTIEDLLLWYLNHVSGNKTLSQSWRANCASMIRSQLLLRVGSHKITEFDFICIDSALVKGMLNEEYAPHYIRLCVNVLKRAFSAACDLRLLASNPLAGYRVQFSLKFGPVAETALTEADLAELFGALQGASRPVNMLFLLMLMFGTRINETRLCRWEHFAGEFWLIPASNTKTRQSHRLPLTPAAKSLLLNYRQWQLKHVGKRTHLFCGDSEVVSIRTAQYWSQQIRFKDFTSHALRKLCRTIIADMGVDTMVGERILNHALPVLLRTYVHSTLDKGVMAALEAYHLHLVKRGFVGAR